MDGVATFCVVMTFMLLGFALVVLLVMFLICAGRLILDMMRKEW